MHLLKLRLLLLELDVTVGATKEIVICWCIPVTRLLRILPHLLLMVAYLLVVVGVSLDIRLDESRSISFQCASIIVLLLCLHLLIQNVPVDMRWECLLEVRLLILEVVTSKVLVFFCVIEEVAVTGVELECITSCCRVVLSIAIVHVVRHIV